MKKGGDILSKNKKEPMNHNRIKEVRLEKHKTQKDLAKLLNVSEQAISYYEKARREPPLKSWVKLADYLGVPVSYLQGLSNINYDNKEERYEKYKVSHPKLDWEKADSSKTIVPIDMSDLQLMVRDDTLKNFEIISSAFLQMSDTLFPEQTKELKKKLSNMDEYRASDLVHYITLTFTLLLDDNSKRDKLISLLNDYDLELMDNDDTLPF